MNNFELTPDQLPNCAEVGRWIARLGMVRAVLDAQPKLAHYDPGSSFDPTYPHEYILAIRHQDTTEWQTDLDYDGLQLHELDKIMPKSSGAGAKSAMKDILKAAEEEPIRPSHNINQQIGIIKRQGRRKVLERTGLIVSNNVPIGAKAALIYIAADVKDAATRELYARDERVQRAVEHWQPYAERIFRDESYESASKLMGRIEYGVLQFDEEQIDDTYSAFTGNW